MNYYDWSNKITTLILGIWGFINLYPAIYVHSKAMSISYILFFIALYFAIAIFGWSIRDRTKPQSLSYLWDHNPVMLVLRLLALLSAFILSILHGFALIILIMALMGFDICLYCPGKESFINIFHQNKGMGICYVLMLILYLWIVFNYIPH